ncbi:MAG: hypothetical protein HXY29_14565 [Rhodocyclaceae bacterium]|nr:hypothetical protein [Rhodocyclaceae bacterium]
MNDSYLISTSRPRLSLCEDDLLEGVCEWNGGWGDNGGKTPLAYQWADHVAEALGFHRVRELPLYWDGQGCVILKRWKEPAAGLENHPARRFRYLALVNTDYDEEIVVGIAGPAALLQFYSLVRPWLALASDPSFRDGKRGDHDGNWNEGANWKDHCVRTSRLVRPHGPSQADH